MNILLLILYVTVLIILMVCAYRGGYAKARNYREELAAYNNRLRTIIHKAKNAVVCDPRLKGTEDPLFAVLCGTDSTPQEPPSHDS